MKKNKHILCGIAFYLYFCNRVLRVSMRSYTDVTVFIHYINKGKQHESYY